MNRKSIESLFDLQFDCSKKILRACLFFDLIVAILDQDQQVHISIFALHIKIWKSTKIKLELETCQNRSNKNWQNTKSERWRENVQGCQKQIVGTFFQRILQEGQPLCFEKAWELFKIFQYFNIFQGMGAVQTMPNQRRWTMFKCSNVQNMPSRHLWKFAAGIFATSSWLESTSWNF